MLPGTATAIIVAVVNFDPLMPQDPFADDPNDPAALFDTEEPMPPLSDEDRRHILEDMELVAQFRAALDPRGVLGIFFMCEDCQENHYYGWDIMEANMRATLAGELSPVHEPSACPAVEAYVPWDYCLGYVDGLNAS